MHDEYILEQLNEESEQKLKEVETSYQNQMSSLRATLELVREQMERESQQKLQNLIAQHRAELGKYYCAVVPKYRLLILPENKILQQKQKKITNTCFDLYLKALSCFPC